MAPRPPPRGLRDSSASTGCFRTARPPRGACCHGTPPTPSRSLADTPFTDAHLAALRGLETLESLNLTRTRVTNAGLVHLEGRTHLAELLLNETAVSLRGLPPLASLTGLRRLGARAR